MLLEMACALPPALIAIYLGIKLACPWLLLDIRYMRRVMPAVSLFESRLKRRIYLVDLFEECVRQHPDKTFILFGRQKYTYMEINERANQIAQIAVSLGLRADDTIAMMQNNEPGFVWTWLGFLKVGVSMALINTNLRGKSLLHCLSLAGTSTILLGDDSELISAIEAVLPDLPNATVYVQGTPTVALPARFVDLQVRLSVASSEDVGKSYREGKTKNDPAVYIYTSGTTGLPKAAVISQRKLLLATVMSGCTLTGHNDVVYITPPLYHSSGLMVGMCNVIAVGATCALARKFSKTNFFNDIRQHTATVIIYIGEMCRYLLTNEKSELDKDHTIRLAIGNGLRQDIFAEFKERFGIRSINEFYAATEGSANFLNFMDVVGSCGRLSPLFEKMLPTGLYQWDVDNECLVRNAQGHCIPVKRGAPGLLLSLISEKQIFDGYKGQKEASESKIVRNVKRDGDQYYNSGDLLYKDKDYNLYFNDRVGDTFRWKGENVSTTEVSNLLTDVDFIIDACVYGVSVPGCDGRAGMATLLLESRIDDIANEELSEISQHLQRVLPSYAIPIFLRLKWGELELTGTHKQTKMKLKQEAFDCSVVGDPMFYYEKCSRTYRALTKDVYEDIKTQTLRI